MEVLKECGFNYLASELQLFAMPPGKHKKCVRVKRICNLYTKQRTVRFAKSHEQRVYHKHSPSTKPCSTYNLQHVQVNSSY
jgi:hypothetical protein